MSSNLHLMPYKECYKKHFIAVIGNPGAGKTTFTQANFKDLPIYDMGVDDENMTCRWIFHDKVFFKKAVIHIPIFEDVILEDLLENTVNKGHILNVFYVYLNDIKQYKERVLFRSKLNGIDGLDIKEYGVSKNAIYRTGATIKKMQDLDIKIKYIDNSLDCNCRKLGVPRCGTCDVKIKELLNGKV